MSKGREKTAFLVMPFSSTLLPFTHLHKHRIRGPRGVKCRQTLNLQMEKLKLRGVRDWLSFHGQPLLGCLCRLLPNRAVTLEHFELPWFVTDPFFLIIFISLCSSPHSASPHILTVTFMLKSSKYIHISEPQICIFNFLLLNSIWWFICSKVIFIDKILYRETGSEHSQSKRNLVRYMWKGELFPEGWTIDFQSQCAKKHDYKSQHRGF